jgi:DNA-binding LacI/PurR family transcriptional regulator
MPTVHDVARRAGVSIATVSRVFGRPDAVAAPTRRRVLTAADELGYTPNTTARALQRGHTGYLGLLVHDLANPFYATVAKAAQLEARRSGLALFCADYGDHPAEELDLAREMARHVDGLLLYPSQPADDALAAAVADLGPTVVLDSPVADTPTVLMSTTDGIDQAVDHLAALGHRRLTYVDAAPTAMFTSLDRRRNVEASCARAGLALTVVGPFSPTFESGVRAADLAVAQEATAVLAFSDQMALGLVRRLTERGVRVGADVSVVGVDDIWIAAQVTPPLTTVRMPCAEAGAAATRLLRQRIDRDGDGDAPASTVVLPTELIVRASTGPAPHGGTT